MYPSLALESSFGDQWGMFRSLLKDRLPHYEANLEEAILELKRFLVLKVSANDTEATLLSPSPMIDELWHYLVLCSKQYVAVCKALFLEETTQEQSPPFLHHNLLASASGEEATQARRERYGNTLSLYQRAFKMSPKEEFWLFLAAGDGSRETNGSNTDTKKRKCEHPDEEEEKDAGTPKHETACVASTGSTVFIVCVQDQQGEVTSFKVSPKTRIAKLLHVLGKQYQIDYHELRLHLDGMRLNGDSTLSDGGIEAGDFIDMYLAQSAC